MQIFRGCDSLVVMNRYLAGWVSLMALSMSVAFCGPSAGAFCDAVCDCRGCSDREYDNCIADYEDAENDADRVGCSDGFGDYADCVASGDGCRKGDADHYCDREKDRWRDCDDDGSNFSGPL
jgi:hypothetical protein